MKTGEKGQAYDIGVLVGRSNFLFYEFLSLGKIRLVKDKSIRVDGDIIDFSQDQQNDTGFYFTLGESTES